MIVPASGPGLEPDKRGREAPYSISPSGDQFIGCTFDEVMAPSERPFRYA